MYQNLYQFENRGLIFVQNIQLTVMKKYSNYQTFTKRSKLSSEHQPIYSQESRLTDENINYSFRKEPIIPQFKQINEIQVKSRINRQQEKNQCVQKRLAKLEILMSKIANTYQMNFQINKDNQKRIQNIERNVQKILRVVGGEGKQNIERLINTDLSKQRLSELNTYKSHIFDSYQNTLTKKLSKTKSIMSIEQRKKQIDREISMSLKQESAKRKKILQDLRKQSLTQKFL